MATAKVIRYTTHPAAADDNERLIRAVFAELEAASPDGLRYAAVRLDDTVSFLHVALLDTDDNPLTRIGAFAEFQAGLADRGTAPPTVADGTFVGRFRAFTD